MPAVANEQFDLPLAKRQKRAPDAQLRAKARGGSKIFAPFRVRPCNGSENRKPTHFVPIVD